MARLTCDAGTVVTADGDLESSLRAQGWVDVDAPKRKPGRPRKSESESEK